MTGVRPRPDETTAAGSSGLWRQCSTSPSFTPNPELTRPLPAAAEGARHAREPSAASVTSASVRGFGSLVTGVANLFRRNRSRSQAGPSRAASAQGWYDLSESQRGGMINQPNSSLSSLVYVVAEPPVASGARTGRSCPPRGEAATGDREIPQQSQRGSVGPVHTRRQERSANTSPPGPPPVQRYPGLDYAQMRPSNRSRQHTEQAASEASRRAQTSPQVPVGDSSSGARQETAHAIRSLNIVPRPSLEAPLDPQRTVVTSSPRVPQESSASGPTLVPTVIQVPPSPNSLPYSQNAPPIAHNASSGGPGPGIAGPSTSRAHHHPERAMARASGSRPSGEYTSNKRPRREHSRDRRY
ncbi:hypothetical protein OF83DRAFT_1141819 [Amylostereum chailletii]|nr:hypothetical protein OF83DRAFT_1141819 [Amylostereum chailletii]